MNTSLGASSTTDAKEQPLLFQDPGWRRVAANFSGGTLSSDGRGEMENRLQQQTLYLRADRGSTQYLAGNQPRLGPATLACLLRARGRVLGLAGTDLARATQGRVRLKLLKVADQVRVSLRRV